MTISDGGRYMPLSKERDRKRKHLVRLKARLESKGVQPIPHNSYSANQSAEPHLDAAGEVVPAYW